MTAIADRGGCTEFSAVLRPPHALSCSGVRALMVLVAAVSAALGLVFLVAGAWPVTAFVGLAALALFAAFAAYAWLARGREVIELRAGALSVERFRPGRAHQRFSFNPRWVRLEQADRADGSTELALVARGRRLVIAACLGHQERRDFAGALAAALAAHRA